MSTNANIIFKHKDDTFETYKHWDGYPETTVPLLQNFLDWMPDSRHAQTDYVVASWFYWVKARKHDFEEEPGTNSDLVLSYGADPRGGQERAWIEHTYIVDMKAGRIEHYRGNFSDADDQAAALEDVQPDRVESFRGDE